jgi:hypothetical protein
MRRALVTLNYLKIMGRGFKYSHYLKSLLSQVQEGRIFIYSYLALLISFEINCFYGMSSRIYEYGR